jgi:uncharacterized protein YbjT (DUF2867 family)
MILVTGASGTVGRHVVEALRVRAPMVAASRAPSGVDQRRFDFLDESGFGHAVEGITAIFLMLPPGLPQARQRFRSLLNVGKSAGVRHIVFLSVRNADRLPMLPHRGLEREIEASGIGWTHLRSNDFMQNFATQLLYREGIRAGQLVSPAGRSRTSYIDARDVAEAAAVVLTSTGHDGKAYSLTGPEELSAADVVETLSQVLQRPVAGRTPSLFRFFRHARQHGVPVPLSAIMTSIGLVARVGYSRGVDPDLYELIGREGRSFAGFVRDHRNVWRAEDTDSSGRPPSQ